MAFFLCLPGAVAADVEWIGCQPKLSQHIPPRARTAMTGSEFAQHIATMSHRQREAAILTQLQQGNLPAFLRNLQPVHLQSTFDNGESVTAILCVMPDYLAIGRHDDFLRIPMTRYTAAAIATQFGFVLPTPKIVDAIYAQSAYALRPQPMAAGPQMRSIAYYQQHHHKIETQRVKRGAALGQLLAGHKKDVVLTNRLTHKPGKVAIYGWHHSVDRPIQPLSTVHGSHYADYSHGVRLVSSSVWIAGQVWPISEVLRHPVLAQVLSAEGVIFALPLRQSPLMVLQQRNPR